MSETRYFLRAVGCPWSEVSKQHWMQIERSVQGRIVDKYVTAEMYDWDPEFRDAAWPS